MITQANVDVLRKLHDGSALLVVPNVWDAVSARTVASVPGCAAVATASWSVAASLGYDDGEVLSRDEMLGAVERIVRAVPGLPVTADLEGGYGDVAETMALAHSLGVAGCNLEDGVAETTLRPFDEAVARVGAAVSSGLVVNARTDAYLAGVDDAFDVAVARGRAYVEAGADCVFVPGVTDLRVIGALVRAIGPVSVLSPVADAPLAELRALGVRRVSFGPGTLRVAMAALTDAATALLSPGS
ncbi:MAG TPA: isocitrate lyase/phosphoenolpyruvate mutase family protein [Solirubrobacteraceae bacterium]|nr:isocitrate lyase/phosphoenolpyruvate mutase family protein [Solirubrobacteraceae bacterium]